MQPVYIDNELVLYHFPAYEHRVPHTRAVGQRNGRADLFAAQPDQRSDHVPLLGLAGRALNCLFCEFSKPVFLVVILRVVGVEQEKTERRHPVEIAHDYVVAMQGRSISTRIDLRLQVKEIELREIDVLAPAYQL